MHWDYCSVITQSNCSCLTSWSYANVSYGPGECRHSGLLPGTRHPLISKNTYWCVVSVAKWHCWQLYGARPLSLMTYSYPSRWSLNAAAPFTCTGVQWTQLPA